MLTKAEIKRLRALTHTRRRAASGLFLAEGVRVVEDLVASGIVLRQAFLAPSLEDNPRGVALAEALRARTRTTAVSEAQLADIAGTESPQGVVAVAETPRRDLAGVELAARALVVVLDAIQDPGNFGTIVRSADAFGAACIVSLPGTVDAWNPKAVRSGAGSSLRVPMIDTALDELLPWLRRHGFRIFGADMNGVDVETVEADGRVALVLGNEGAGLSTAVLEVCDALVAVPIRGSAESLNVGVAAGILLYSLARKS
ncbi:MAG: RNA methyltransferase [Gemmatimonadota bacterium]